MSEKVSQIAKALFIKDAQARGVLYVDALESWSGVSGSLSDDERQHWFDVAHSMVDLADELLAVASNLADEDDAREVIRSGHVRESEAVTAAIALVPLP